MTRRKENEAHAQTYKKNSEKMLKEISDHPEFFAKNPQKNFKRKRKLPFEEVLKLVLSMAGKSIRGELIDYFGLKLSTPTASALVQQKNKINYSVFEILFHNFVDAINEQDLLDGYRLIAMDGSDLHVPINKNEPDSFHQNKNRDKPYNLLHINVLYDLRRRIYVDFQKYCVFLFFDYIFFL